MAAGNPFLRKPPSINLSEQRDFTWANRDQDPFALALKPSPFPGVRMAALAAQVEALQKIRDKVPTWYRSGLDLPTGLPLEQCSSQAAAQFKATLFQGQRMADLTGGLGIDAYFFAQHFAQVDYVEQQAPLCAAARHNFPVLGTNNIRVAEQSAESFIAALQTSEQRQIYDLVYVDPARRDGQLNRVFRLEDCSPDIVQLQTKLLSLSHKVLLKTAPLLDIRAVLSQLSQVAAIWAVAVGDECKEVLYLLQKTDFSAENIPISAIQIKKDGSHTVFQFTLNEETAAAPEYALPRRYLYEPHAAILKAGAFKTYAQRFGLAKLHPHSHLYTADAPIPGALGRAFEIIAQCPYDRKALRQHLPQGQANLSTRNFPDNTAFARQKLGLREGGDAYVFATTDIENKKILLVCKKI